MSTRKERDKLKKLEESSKFGRLIYKGGVNLRDSDDPKDKAEYARILNENRNKAAAYANQIGEKVTEPFRDRNRRRMDDVAASSDVGGIGGLSLNQLLNTPNDMRNISPQAVEQGSADTFFGRIGIPPRRNTIPPFAIGGASAFNFRTPLGVGQSTDEFTRNNLQLYFPRGNQLVGQRPRQVGQSTDEFTRNNIDLYFNRNPLLTDEAYSIPFMTGGRRGRSTDEFTRNNLDLYFPNRGISMEGLAEDIFPRLGTSVRDRFEPSIDIPRVQAEPFIPSVVPPRSLITPRAVPLDIIRANIGQADPRFTPLTGFGAEIGRPSYLLDVGLALDKDAPSYNALIASVPGLSINPNLPATTFANNTLNATINPFGIAPSGARVDVANLTPAQREALRNEIERQRGRLAGVRPDTGINLSYFGGV
tara:strand:+ start:1641 stop:2900 length:1260 start_codon:yes stop_codon:yes gene_type:complete